MTRAEFVAELVGMHEIAERAGVKVNTVHAWRRRHDDFPEPYVELAMGPVWLWQQIQEWFDAAGRVHTLPPTRMEAIG